MSSTKWSGVQLSCAAPSLHDLETLTVRVLSAANLSYDLWSRSGQLSHRSAQIGVLGCAHES